MELKFYLKVFSLICTYAFTGDQARAHTLQIFLHGPHSHRLVMDEQFSWRLRQVSKAQSRLVIILAGKERERERQMEKAHMREKEASEGRSRR